MKPAASAIAKRRQAEAELAICRAPRQRRPRWLRLLLAEVSTAHAVTITGLELPPRRRDLLQVEPRATESAVGATGTPPFEHSPASRCVR
jgi:hypothetical protein